jgi:hypothetical protein
MVIAVVLAVALPSAIGFLAGFSNIFVGEPRTPSWLHWTRVGLALLSVSSVFAWFVAGEEERFVGRFVVVVSLTWLLGECTVFGVNALLSRIVDAHQGPLWSFRARGVLTTLGCGIVGLAAGLALRSGHRDQE